ncbi:hypothetical protein K504DRAFT_461446 [Pleomassaria siparia CBS 279.74]|uniref:Uncharacterized protein n=1 Tax=Pleomassaria siparia CBS 279.74 TaxID=1314801 RepID=A0A6G1KJ57_9PLEO|nr:hypothetical protein K504DRAFT_461446 [Pleomassaria siparia CBS 279.74]
MSDQSDFLQPVRHSGIPGKEGRNWAKEDDDDDDDDDNDDASPLNNAPCCLPCWRRGDF